MIYFDNNATHPLLEIAKKEWVLAQDKNWFNPAGVTSASARVRALIKDCKRRFADAFGREEDQVLFTSGATESNNLAIKALSELIESHQRVACHVDEHASVIEPIRRYFAKRHDWFCAEDIQSGAMDATNVRAVILGAANSETGEIYPIEKALEWSDANDLWSFCDATQWIGKYSDYSRLRSFHFITASAHKWGGPKGIGLILLPRGLSLPALLLGGGQQGGMRSGTENYPCIASMYAAWRERLSLSGDAEHRNEFEDALVDSIPGVKIVSREKSRLWNTSYLIMPKHKSENWVSRLEKKGFIVGTGSACSTAKLSEPHILSYKAMMTAEERSRMIRISSSHTTTRENWQLLLKALVETFHELHCERSKNSQVIEI